MTGDGVIPERRETFQEIEGETFPLKEKEVCLQMAEEIQEVKKDYQEKKNVRKGRE